MNTNNYVKAMINRMARSTRTMLSARHEAVLEYAYKYYEEHNVGPLYYNFKKHIGATKKEINRLFPHGLYSIYTWVGIPIRTGENLCKRMATIKVDDYRDVYLDHNGTTPIRPEVQKTLVRYAGGNFGFGNPSSSTLQGKKAYDLVYSARKRIADCLSAKPEEIVFTGCGSEANNLAIKGIAFNHLEKYGHIITSRIEHPSVLKTMHYLETIGFDVSYIDVENDGVVSPDSVKKAIRKNTILVSIMTVNNEIGTLNPIVEIGAICGNNGIPFMTDAIQGFGKIPIKPRDMGISLLSISGHKIYAPKGIGGLL